MPKLLYFLIDQLPDIFLVVFIFHQHANQPLDYYARLLWLFCKVAFKISAKPDSELALNIFYWFDHSILCLLNMIIKRSLALDLGDFIKC